MFKENHYLQCFLSLGRLQKFAVFFLFFNGIFYWPLSIQAGFGPQHFLLMLAMIIVGACYYCTWSKALIIGSIYFAWQITIALIHSTDLRWSTIIFSFGLIFSYVGFYHLVYFQKVFTLDIFIELLKFIMLAAFVVTVLQQIAVVVGIHSFPLINLVQTYTEKGPLACNSLYQEMSSFARFMLVCYYGYVKCNEIKRGKGTFSPMALLKKEHRWITIRFLWMTLTMGSATAMTGLLIFSLYFITKKNAFILIPLFIIGYGFLDNIENDQLQRSMTVIEATVDFDRDELVETDNSAASRVTPIINSFHADFSKKETWFGHGVDYARDNELVIRNKATLFDDYGLILFLLGWIFSLSCACKINSLAALFMVMGLGGGCGGNIHYAWELAMIMTVVRYFLEQDAENKKGANIEVRA